MNAVLKVMNRRGSRIAVCAVTSESRREAYSLTEIMIAVLLVGVLMGIVVPSVMKARQRVRIERARADVEMLAAAVRQLAWDTGKWPGAEDRTSTRGIEVWDLSTPEAGLLSRGSGFDAESWKGPYAMSVPLDPWGQPYFFDQDYFVITGGVRQAIAVVGSFGPNRVGRNIYDEDNIFVWVDD